VGAIAFALLAALSWGTSAGAGALAGRRIGTAAATFLTSTAGLLLVAGPALATGVPSAPATAWLAATAAGVCYLSGSFCWMLGVTRGDVGVVTTIVSTDGALAAVAAIAFGEAVQAGEGLALGLVAIGLAAAVRRPRDHPAPSPPAAIAFAFAGAASFAAVFVLSAHAEAIGTLWVALTARATSVVLLAPLVARRTSLAVPRDVRPALLAAAVTDVSGYLAFLAASRQSVAIASVLTSQYALVAVVLGVVLYRERLARVQVAGILVAVAGVALLGALRA
jgi:drug/metabolite transporter (DMT)-like permease